mmetsp:Transcript_16695/g.33761  ORF Transcript_16695/g.33761 Transcript_16695/m.33761 type:complete len:1121 (+) Transcript_16695:152-3514(+)
MVIKHPMELEEDPGLALLGPKWTVKPSEDEGRDGVSKLYVNALGKKFSSLRQAWESAGGGSSLEFLTSGHPWIGQRVTRIFDKKPSDGTIVSWLPPQEGEGALWHVEHDDGDSEDLEENEAEDALEEFHLRTNSRVEASFQGKWYTGVLRKVTRSKLEPYGVKCDSDKNNSMLLWVPRKNVRLPTSARSLAYLRPYTQGQILNRALVEHKKNEREGETSPTATNATRKKRKKVKGVQKQAQAGRRRSGPSASPNTTASPSIVSWNDYQRMHRGRQVTTDEWRAYVRAKREEDLKRTKSAPATVRPSAAPATSSTAAAAADPKTNAQPNDGKRVRKKKINPDYLWGEDLRNPKRALVARYKSTQEEGPTDNNDDKCGVCGGGGNLLCCDGPCLRAFHLRCLRLKEADLPEKEWYCKDCVLGRPPQKPKRPVGRPLGSTKTAKKGRPRPPPINIPAENGEGNRFPLGVSSKSCPIVDVKSAPPVVTSPMVTGPGTPRSTRRNAGVPARFKDSYLTLTTPNENRGKVQKQKRKPASEPNTGNKKKQKTGDSVEETKARLEERLRALETYLSKKTPTPKANSPAVFAPPSPLTLPSPSPSIPREPSSCKSAPPSCPAFSPPVSPIPPIDAATMDLSAITEGLEPWRRCAKCTTGRRSMTCAKQMCAVCCRSGGACITHCRMLAGDTLRVFKGFLQGRQGKMIAKVGRSISLRVGPEPNAILYVEENTVCLVEKGPKHKEYKGLPGDNHGAKKRGTSRQCLRCKKRFRNKNALASHQRSCRPLAAGVQVATPYGQGIVKRPREDEFLEIKLSFCTAFIRALHCRLIHKKQPVRPKKKRKTPSLQSPVIPSLAEPRAKRQTSLPIRFRKAQLSKPMLLCFELIQLLKRHKYGPVFSEPVPRTIPRYHDIIKHPMDLGTIENNLFEKEGYDLDQFEDDVKLVWANAITFNPVSHPVNEMAVTLSKIFRERFEKVRQQAKALEKLALQKQKQKKSKPTTSSSSEGLDKEVKRLAQKMEVMRKRLQTMSGASRPKPARSSPRPVTYSERQVLKQQIISLPPEHLTGVAEIVRDSMPDDDTTEVEIDLEALDSATLRKLQKYVGGCMLRLEGSSNGALHQSSSDEESDSD